MASPLAGGLPRRADASAPRAARPAGRLASVLAGLGYRTLGLGAAVAVIVLIALPLLSLLVQAALPSLFSAPASLTPSLGGVQSLLQDPYTLASGVDSLVLAALTAVVASAIGLGVAYLVVLTDFRYRSLLWGLVWLVFIAPSFLLAQGWELLLSPGGLATGLAGGLFTRTLLSPVGVLCVLALKLFPFATLAVAPALEGLGQDAVHAARLAGADAFAAWRRILLPLIAPSLFAGGLIIFAEVLGDFGVAATLAQSANFPLVTYSIYAALEQFPANFSEAAAASLLLVGSVALAQWGQRAAAGRRVYATRAGGSRSLAPVRLGSSQGVTVALCALLALLAFVVPAGTTFVASFRPSVGAGLGPGAFTLANYVAALHLSYGAESFVRSLVYAALAALIGTFLGLWITLAWRRGGGLTALLLQGLLTTTIAVPGIVLGAGYIFFWDQPALAHVGLILYGTPAALLLAYVAGGLPYAVRVATGAMAQVPESAVSAARASGAGLAALVRHIVVPMLGGTWLRIGLMLFAGVMFELPVSQLLYPPGGPTLAVSIVHQFNSTLFGVGAALTVLSTTGVALVAALLLVFVGGGRRQAGLGRIASPQTPEVALGGAQA